MSGRSRSEMEREWVLVEKAATRRLGRKIYFRDMTAIGPRCTSDPSQAARFLSREAALASPANRHLLCIFEEERLDGGEETVA